MIKAVIYCYEGMAIVDAVVPYELLKVLPDVQVFLVGKKANSVVSDSEGMSLNIQHSIEDHVQADLLIIPGAYIAFVREMHDTQTQEWIKTVDATTKKTLGVCSGATILAATGVLQGKRATSHWRVKHLLTEYGATLSEGYIVEDGKYLTTNGISGSLDVTALLISQLLDEEQAKIAQLSLAYVANPMFHTDSLAEVDDSTFNKTLTLLEKKARKMLSNWEYVKYSKVIIRLKKFIPQPNQPNRKL